MHFSPKTIVLLLATVSSASAFTVGGSGRANIRQGMSSLKMAEESNIEALRAAAAKAREDAERLRKVRGRHEWFRPNSY